MRGGDDPGVPRRVGSSGVKKERGDSRPGEHKRDRCKETPATDGAFAALACGARAAIHAGLGASMTGIIR